ncbi:hypothetical protein M758_UG148200 [Ceratodon purpureus]|nr:hypothetical protein M758_UG148200 [Ceratodon purpureus]
MNVYIRSCVGAPFVDLHQCGLESSAIASSVLCFCCRSLLSEEGRGEQRRGESAAMEAVAMAKGVLTMAHKPLLLNCLFSRSSSITSKSGVIFPGLQHGYERRSFVSTSDATSARRCSSGGTAWSRRSFVVRASSAAGEEKQPIIGFLGLGIVGTAMARNLVKAGYDVTVWNISISKRDALVSEGAKCGETPEQTTAACDITFAMLADPAGAMEVACGPQGAVKGLSAGKGYVDVSTVDDETAKAITDAVRKTGAEFLEAPVSGSKKPAVDGTLIFLTAGDKSLFERASPMLDVMGTQIRQCGGPSGL